MASIEFRNRGADYDYVDPGDQLVLPIGVFPKREVYWFHGYQQTKKRLIGSKVVTNLVLEEGGWLPKTTHIDADAIAELNDPDLRYALRFADAAEAVGWTQDSPGMKSAHDVLVTATDDGVDSQLLHAVYTGVGEGSNDSFMQNLHRAAPN